MLRKHIAVDLGTANTLVFVQSQGIVINEPSVVAVDTINERVIAVGKEAKDYIGKTPQRIPPFVLSETASSLILTRRRRSSPHF